MKKLKNILNEVLSEARFYVTYNKGRGQGKGLIKSVESDYEDARHWRSYNDAEKYVKMASKGTSQYGGRTSYWVSDINMNRIDRNYQIEEAKQLDTKIFDQGALQDSMKQIRKLVGIEEADEGFSHPSVEYSEFRFKDGSGGFQFQWEHGVKRYGRLSLSISSPARNSKVEVTVLSAYDKKVFENKVSNQNYLRNIKTWRDLDNLTMQTVISKSDSLIKKFEKQSYAELEKDRDAQAAFYGSRAKTGRIGYGLTQQPRKR